MARYRIVERIGSGGMGVVFRAEDAVLGRTVALKVLSGQFLENRHARARFLRESRVAAALNHPNICTIHEVGEVGEGDESPIEGVETFAPGTPYIVMELVEGRTLDSLLAGGALALPDLLRIAVRIGEGMADAHAKGIVHRDLKPQNVMVGPEGRVKILDFGLAKPVATSEERDAASASVELTVEGMVLGTVTHMSPEQAQGKPVDSRSDVFSFGVLLYEMATGQRPFPGDTAASVMAKILESEPEPVSSVRPDLPPELDGIVRRCLKKAREDRFNDTRDLVAALKDLREVTTSGGARVARGDRDAAGSGAIPALRRRPIWLRWAAATLIVVAAVAAFALRDTFRSSPRTGPVPGVHRQLTFTGNAFGPAISPDGQRIAYVTHRSRNQVSLVVRDVSGKREVELFSARMIRRLEWSPDGTQLMFATLHEDGEAHVVYAIPRLGGDPRRLTEDFPQCIWGPNGERYAGWSANSTKLVIRSLAGESKELLLGIDSTWLRDVDWSHATGRFVFATQPADGGGCTLWTIDEDGENRTKLAELEDSVYRTRWSPRGDAVYYLMEGGGSRGLWKISVDRGNGVPTGDPRQLLAGLESGGEISFSGDGARMVYARIVNRANLWVVPLNGDAPTRLTTGNAWDDFSTISPDGNHVAFMRMAGEEQNIFVIPVAGGTERQLTFGPSPQSGPAWSPDGAEVAFVSDDGGTNRVWRVAASGGTPRSFPNSVPSTSGMLAWAPCRRILYQSPGNQNYRLLDPESEAEQLLFDGEPEGFQFHPRFSPDGKFLALSWNRGGVNRLWLVSLEDESERLLFEPEYAQPLGWSLDSKWVYALTTPTRNPRILRVAISGGEAEVVSTLPFDRLSHKGQTTARDGTFAVVTVIDIESEVWMVEKFDPDVE